MSNNKIKFYVAILAFLVFNNSYGLLKIDINKSGVKTMKIVVANFSGFDNSIADIMQNNLENSGNFSIYRVKAMDNNVNFSALRKDKVEAIVFGNIEKLKNGKFSISIYVYDIWTKESILSQRIIVGKTISRRVSHIISDKVYYSLLGEKSFFDTNIAYVSIDKNSKLKYKLEVVDSDGLNAQLVFASKEPIMSPSWSPNSDKLAYVSFTSGRSRVYIQHILEKQNLKILPKFDGIASSPNWHPNGKSLILTLSKNGNQDIYQYFLNGKLKRITNNPAIDTEASFSPDGKFIVWTSNRNGSAAIYLKNLSTNKIIRLKINGNYNVNPSFSPNGKRITLIHNDAGSHKVAEFDIATNDLIILTENNLDESPSFSPNGKMIIYSKTKNNNSTLSIVATDKNYSLSLSDGSKEVREPVWSGFL